MVGTIRNSAGDSLRQVAGGSRNRRRRLWRGLLLVAAIAGIGAAVSLLSALRPLHSDLPAPTHAITRGDLVVTVTEQGTLESANNTEIKCRVRGSNTIIWVVENGTAVAPGDELVRLDTLMIEEEISERTKFAHLSRSTAERSKADVASAELAVREYLEGNFVTQLAGLETELAIAESRLLSAENMLQHARMMAESRYVNELDVEEKEFAVEQADLDMRLKKTQIEVLKQFTKSEQLATLHGNLNAAKAQHEADLERWHADQERLRVAEEELKLCVVRAERSGIVIYPSSKAWEEAPEIEEGATVHKDQVLLLMPDLTSMRVKVGIHESMVDRLEPGMLAKVALPNRILEGELSTVAPVAQPAGWWTGNVVKYDTIIELPSVDGLKPGMTAEVEVILARYNNVLTIPAGAVVETDTGCACWVKTLVGPERRGIEVGESNQMDLVLLSGVAEGEQVILDPLAYVEEAQREAAATLDKTDDEIVLSEI